MKNIHVKKIIYTILGGMFGVMLFVGFWSPATGQNQKPFSTAGGPANIAQLELAREFDRGVKFEDSVLHSENESAAFRIAGTSVFDGILSMGRARFDRLAVGYPTVFDYDDTDPKLMVNGTITIKELADPARTSPVPACVNDFGVISVCDEGVVTDPDPVVTGCPAPTIERFGDNEIYFDLNGATASTTFLYNSSDPSGFGSWTNSAGGSTSPRAATLIPNEYYKMKTLCSDGTTSDDSNIMQYTGIGINLYITHITTRQEGSGDNYQYMVDIHFTGGDNTKYVFLERYNTESASWEIINSPQLADGVHSNLCSVLENGFQKVRLRYQDNSGISNSYDFSYTKPNPCGCSTTEKQVDWNGDVMSWDDKVYYSANGDPLFRCSTNTPLAGKCITPMDSLADPYYSNSAVF